MTSHFVVSFAHRASMLVLIATLSSSHGARAANEESESGHFHHVHLNVSDVAKTAAFYEKVFGVVPIEYADTQPALLTERSFIFMNRVAAPIKSQLQTGIIHIGWSGIDGKSEFDWWQKQGIEFYKPLSRIGPGEYFYLYGPDREVIEIWTNEKHHRLNHIHMLAADPKRTAEWFSTILYSQDRVTKDDLGLGNFNLRVDNVTLHVFPDVPAFRPKERTGPMEPTDGSGIDHLAFSFRDLKRALRRIESFGVKVERPLRVDDSYRMRHAFVRSPNGVLVELVESRSWPEAAWE